MNLLRWRTLPLLISPAPLFRFPIVSLLAQSHSARPLSLGSD